MMQSKRIFVALLVVVLLTFCTLTAFAAAEEAPSIDIAVSASSDTAIIDANGVVKAEKDAVVTFTVAAKENKVSVLAASLYVKFNPAHLELDKESIQVSEGGAYVVQADRIAIDFNAAMSGELVSVSFKVKDVHVATNVVVEVTDIVDPSFEDININWTNAKTTVDVHTYGDEQVRDLIPDDCTAGKEIFRVCTTCPADKNEEIVVAYPNEESHDENGAAPTCTDAKICAREGCNGVVEEALGHDDSGASRNCTTDQICAREGCGAVLMEKYGNHDESGAPATCTTAQVCAREGCDFEIVPALGHDASGAAATCLAAKVCAREGCNYIITPKPEHNASGPDATCTTDKVCANEGCTVVLEKKLGHDVSGPAADCTTDKVCARCKAVLKEALGHDESGKAASCTTDKVCARPNCNYIIEERFGHDESGADATCAQPKVCVTCGEVLVAKLDAPEDHVYGEWVVEIEATMSSTGSQYKVCELCENKVTEEIPEKSSAWLIILIVVGVLVLGGGGFAAYWFLGKNKKAKAESEETTEENSEEKTEEAPVEAEATAEATEEKTEE